MYKAGLWESEITPPLGCGIPGYGKLRFGSGVKDKLYAKAFVVSDGTQICAFLAVDNCSLTGISINRIIERICGRTSLKYENILVASTHTHTGGPRAGAPLDGNDAELDGKYVDYCVLTAADAVINAYNNMSEAKLRYAKGEVKGISFVRDYVMKGGSVRTNPGRLNKNIVKPYGEADYSLPMLFVEKPNGEAIGVIYNFACHQDCVDGTLYSGDYSSVVSKILKKEYGNDFISIFFCGTAGNINHFDVSVEKDAPDHYKHMAARLAQEIDEHKHCGEYLQGSICAAKIKKTYETRLPSETEREEYAKIVKTTVVPENTKLAADSPKEIFDYFIALRMLNLLKTITKTMEITVQAVLLGNLTIYGIQGEVFSGYGEILKKGAPTDKAFIFTVANSDSFYMPTAELYDTDIYEAKYGSAKLYAGDVQNVIETAVKLAETLEKTQRGEKC